MKINVTIEMTTNGYVITHKDQKFVAWDNLEFERIFYLLFGKTPYKLPKTPRDIDFDKRLNSELSTNNIPG